MHCRSVAHWPNGNQSYDPEIVRSGVTVALQSLADRCLRAYQIMPFHKLLVNYRLSQLLKYDFVTIKPFDTDDNLRQERTQHAPNLRCLADTDVGLDGR